MNASVDSSGWKTLVWRALAANAVIWGVVGAVTAWRLTHGQMIPCLLCIGLGLAASQWVLYSFLRRGRNSIRNLERLTELMMATLEAQTTALEEQARQIAVLQAASDHQLRQQVSSALNGRVASNLASIVEGLEQAETSLPDMLTQTRDWVARTRRLAANTYAGLQTISGEITEWGER